MDMYDVAIIGAGPAGISAALNLKLHNKRILWFGSRELSAKVGRSEKIANYPGVPMVGGMELNDLLIRQIDDMGLTLTDRMVTNITATRGGFKVLGGNEIYDAKAIILATGSVAAKGFAGEKELLGRGVSYCATCDGFLYKDRVIAVYCGAKRYEHEVKYLSEIAETVHLFTPYKDCGINLNNVKISDKPFKQITGSDRVSGIVLTDGREINVDAVFIMRDSVSPAVLINGIETDGAHIIVDRNMKTNKNGCFAAGDCTGRPYQIAKAVGEGNVAAHAVLEYLAGLEGE